MQRIALLALVLVLGPAAARADEGFDRRKAVAAEYVALYLETTDLSALATQSMQPLLTQIAANQPELWKEKSQRLTAIAIGSFTGALGRALSSIDGEMAGVFTLAELVALRDFYSSPEGRSVMAKMPAFMQQIMPRVMQQAMSSVGDILAGLEAEGVTLK